MLTYSAAGDGQLITTSLPFPLARLLILSFLKVNCYCLNNPMSMINPQYSSTGIGVVRTGTTSNGIKWNWMDFFLASGCIDWGFAKGFCLRCFGCCVRRLKCSRSLVGLIPFCLICRLQCCLRHHICIRKRLYTLCTRLTRFHA